MFYLASPPFIIPQLRLLHLKYTTLIFGSWFHYLSTEYKPHYVLLAGKEDTGLPGLLSSHHPHITVIDPALSRESMPEKQIIWVRSVVNRDQTLNQCQRLSHQVVPSSLFRDGINMVGGEKPGQSHRVIVHL